MYRKILVPLDGSTFAECSLAHVKAIATGCQVPEVVFMTVIDHIQQFPGMDRKINEKNKEELRTAAKKYLADTSEKMKKEGINAETNIVEGSPADMVLEYMKTHGIDLLIMSTHGASGAGRRPMGSTAEKIIRNSTVPVLAVSGESCLI
jgi:nucleotide-binding universal stress UspA family protein